MSESREELPVSSGRPRNREWSQTAFQLSILVIAVLGYLWLFWQVRDGRYLPAWSDEFGYYNNTRSYVENGSLKGAILVEENVSPIGQFDTHGFAYTLLHGLIARVFGFHRLNMILFNLACLLLALALIPRFDIGTTQKVALASSILLYMMVPIWLFTYMQETMQIGVGVLAGFMLWKLYGAGEAGRQRRYAVAYLAVLAVASLFRPSWSFAAVGLIPLATNRRQVVFYSGVSVAAVLVSFVYLRLFCAPYSYGLIGKGLAELQAGRPLGFLGLVFSNLATNVRYFFFTVLLWPMGTSESGWVTSRIAVSYVLSKYLLVALCGFSLWRGLARRDKLALAAGAVTGLNLLVLLLLYDARDWVGPRAVAAMFPLLLIALLPCRRLSAVIPLFLLVLFPQAMSFTENVVVFSHRAVAARYDSSPEAVQAFQDIGRQIQEPRLTTVLVSELFYAMDDIPLVALPMRSRAGYPIRYTFNALGGDDLALRKPGFVDYVLVPDTLAGPALDPDHATLLLERVDVTRDQQ